MNNINTNEIITIVNNVLDIFYSKESYLLENDSSERNLVFHFSNHFIDYINNTKYKDYNIDCEHNRNCIAEKNSKKIMINDKEYKIFPDFIMHKRGTNENNLLAIEFKKHNNYNKVDEEKDLTKLKYLTNQSTELKYKLGLFIKFGKTKEQVIIRKFINGIEKK